MMVSRTAKERINTTPMIKSRKGGLFRIFWEDPASNILDIP
jgi:hypothetical protein